MSIEDKMDFLVDNMQGKSYEYVQDLINAYYSLKYDLEDVKEEYQNYRDHSKVLNSYEESGMRDADFH